MAVSMVFPGQVFGSNSCSKTLKGLPLSIYKRTGQQTYSLTNTKRMLKYSNRGNTTRIRPFQGKKEVLNYFQQLTKCMGDNIEFNAEIISKGDDDDSFTIAVYWHLDWNKIQIPFTKGFSMFVLSKGGERLLIKKVQVVTEPPLKPGALTLNLLKIVTSVFDAFPEATKLFLRSPHVILLRIYSLVLAPFLKPLLACYINLWKLIATALIFAFNVYVQISKLFNK